MEPSVVGSGVVLTQLGGYQVVLVWSPGMRLGQVGHIIALLPLTPYALATNINSSLQGSCLLLITKDIRSLGSSNTSVNNDSCHSKFRYSKSTLK